MQLWETVQDSWDHDAEARITAGCIAGRIQNLSQRFHPSPVDPAYSQFLSLTSAAKTSPVNNSNSGSSTIESSLEAAGSNLPVSPSAAVTIINNSTVPNPEAVPLLFTSNNPSANQKSPNGLTAYEMV